MASHNGIDARYGPKVFGHFRAVELRNAARFCKNRQMTEAQLIP
jgi:hypothetical protein